MTHPIDDPVHGQPHAAVWPAGMPHALAVPDESLWCPLERNAEEVPEAPALHFLDRRWTWAELHAEALALAGGLHRLSVGAGDRVLLFMQNCPQYVLACHALWRLGAVALPVNPMNKADELGHYMQDSGARVALASADIAPELQRASAALPADARLRHLVWLDLADALPPALRTPEAARAAGWPTAWCDWLTTRAPRVADPTVQAHEWAELLAPAGPLPPFAGRADDLALLPYTSGTTGAPKGCRHTPATLGHNALSTGPWLGLGSRPGDAQLVVVPMFHITGLVMGLLGAVRQRATVVLLPRWDRDMAARAIASERVTHWPNIPTMVIDLLAAPGLDGFDLSSLRYIGGGGTAMPQAVADRLRERFGLDYVEGYGLTETAAPTHTNPPAAVRRGSLCIPYPSTRARVVDPETLADLPAGEVGEVLVSGPQVFQGYWQRPEADAEAFVQRDGRRWFRTGDLARVDAQGYYHLADRLKRMINASGYKVWPAEVEGLLHHHPGVQEVCVVRQRDDYRGERVKAVVVRRAGHEALTPEALIAWCREHIAAYKVPREIDFVDALPRNATGKLMWRLVQDAEDRRAAG